jgi:hypothetical protein
MTLDDVFMKVVFLLGAGASKDAGCKLSGEMMDSLEKAINGISISDNEYYKYQKDFEEIYKFIIASLKYQAIMKNSSENGNSYVNIEDFVMVLRQLIDKEFTIPYPLIGNWNDKILKWELSNKDVFDRFRRFITRQLVEDWTHYDLVKAENMLKPLRDLLDNPDRFKINIFSLNYDLIFEGVFNSPTIRLLDNGFSEKSISDNQIKYWNADFDDPNSPTKINLFKLHGSMDWEYSEDTEEISIKESLDDGREPLIIFGSPMKMLSFDPFLCILSKFRTLLEEATIFIVIGYSFHDKYINNLLIQQLGRNTKDFVPKQLIIVNPCYKGKTEAQVAEELKNIQDDKSINDIINFKHISPERIKLITLPASIFYEKYFSKNAELLRIELEKTEKSEKIF